MKVRALVVAAWIVSQLGLNALLCLAYEPKGTLVFPLVCILAVNMYTSVAGWEMAQGRAFFFAKRSPPPPPLPATLFVKRMKDHAGEWYSAWTEADVAGKDVGIYRFKGMRASRAHM